MLTGSNKVSKTTILGDRKNVIVLRVIYGAYAILFLSYAGAYISEPNDALFFYAIGSRVSTSWVMMILCTLAEVHCLTSAVACCLFATYNGLSYVYAMKSLSKYDAKNFIGK